MPKPPTPSSETTSNSPRRDPAGKASTWWASLWGSVTRVGADIGKKQKSRGPARHGGVCRSGRWPPSCSNRTADGQQSACTGPETASPPGPAPRRTQAGLVTIGAYVQLSPRLPCRQPCRRGSSTRFDRHLQHLTQKDAALAVLDTHAGAGLFRAGRRVTRPRAARRRRHFRLLPAALPQGTGLAPALQAYVDMVQEFNTGAAAKSIRARPSSPTDCCARRTG